MHKSYLLFASNKRHFNCLAIPGKYILYNKLVFFSLLELQLKHKMKFSLFCFVFLVSASFSAGNLDDNLNVNHDHETEIMNENDQEKTYPFLDKLKEIMIKLKTNKWTNKLQEIIDDYNTLQSNPLEQNHFKKFANNIQDPIFNDTLDRIKQGIELIGQNVNL